MGLWVEQLASAPDAHPLEVSGVGPSPLICVLAIRLQVCARAAYPAFTVQGMMGEGHQRLQLLRRVL